MSRICISVENISKRYRLGKKEKQSETFVGQLSHMFMAPFDNLKRLQGLNQFGVEDDSVFWALKDISFEVKDGEVLGIIGRNGAGKSTLLKILSQITEPTSGRIEIQGRVASLLEVGTGFHPELSGRENIYMNGTILGMTRKEIDSRFDEIIDFSGVEKFIDTPVKFYSSGMKVRLGFSVAAHLDPEILIIDEVLAVGDYEFQKKCLGKMEDVSKKQGRTVLFVSHQMDAIRNLCPNSILLDKGRIIFQGETNEVIGNYLGDSTKQLKKNFERKGGENYIVELSISSEKLKQNILEIIAHFEAMELIDYPVLGFVLYNQIGTPVFGSNPRFHSFGYNPNPSRRGKIVASCDLGILHSGIYHISIWFGDRLQDFEYFEKGLSFEYISRTSYIGKPNTLQIGSIDVLTKWTFEDSK
ncbi:ABC transporter ATP-binding protein [Algoriphagus mannitolivorans]|uniref:ABC transporter ATP-binding protein n=1 Tax=Algoriphagus mannitolivorans TaxID=226504 RepID=UPI00040B8AB8|nr:ABC transporter ATP-binding protein [Algoriphagus mannitolivorans]